MGEAGCFSFYPSKNLGAFGEGGAVVTNNPKLAEKMQMLRSHGEQTKYYHSVVGWNRRMDGIQGAVLSVKLQHLPKWNEARRKHAQLYNELLSSMDDIIAPINADDSKHVYHIYAVRVKNRDELKKKLAEQEIGTAIHYPLPIHLQKAYGFLKHSEGDFPVSEKCVKEILSLPMFPELRPAQVEAVCQAIKTSIPSIV
jgi:dTDP-4-amino-4,6-dideoxygalactose transaminase